MTFCPAAGQPLLLTTGFDGQIKQWSISRIKRSKGLQTTYVVFVDAQVFLRSYPSRSLAVQFPAILP